MPGSLSALASRFPRIITGVLLAAALVSALLLGGLYLRAAICLVAVLALFEFLQMHWPGTAKPVSKLFGLLACLALFCPVTQREPRVIAVILVLVLLWSALAFLFDYGRGNVNARFGDHAVLPLGIMYVPVLLQLALYLGTKEQFLVVLAAIASDTAAYYTGSAFGRHKIWPSVSPKKSWEGSVGGFCASIAVVTAMACLPYAGGALYGGDWRVWVIIGAVLNVAAQLGDFFESALKRAHGIKDSGSILPGHGGILDRIDSILFALAAYSAIRLLLENAPALAARFIPA